MPRRKQPVNPAREREIGKAVRQARVRLRYGQREFASALGLTRDQVANVEAGRTPLTYKTAWSMRETFGLRLSFLAGFTSEAAPDQDIWIPPDSPEFGGRSLLFSEVAREAYLNPMDNAHRVQRFPSGVFGRAYFLGQICDQAEAVMVSVPDAYVPDAGLAASKAIRDACSRFPMMPSEIVEKTARDLDALQATVGASYSAQNQGLTKYAKTLEVESVKTVLQDLIERLRRATKTRGGKTALAAWLGVHRQCVTDWLSGRREPGGGTTLRMLQWVEAQEAKQQQGFGDADTLPKPETRSRKPNEKSQKTGPPKE